MLIDDVNPKYLNKLDPRCVESCAQSARRNMDTYILGTFLEQKEGIGMEFKEFCLKESIYNLLNARQIRSLIYESHVINKFNDIVLFNTYKYLEIYLAKYMSSFHNCKTNHSNMSFLVGVDDDSEITGIPFKGDMVQTLPAIQRYIQTLIDTDLHTSCCLSVRVWIHKCDIQMDLLDDTIITKQLRMQHKQQHHYTIVRRKFNKKRRQWNKAIMKYKGKLQSVFDDPNFRKEFEAFLREQNMFDTFEKDVRTYPYVVDLDKVKDYKQNKDSFIYWLIYFKDLKVSELLKIKPKPPVFPKQTNAEFCAVTQLTNLRHRWLSNNDTLNYYVLKVDIQKKHTCTHDISFIDPRRRHWRTVKRYLEDDDPRSKDIF